MTVPFGGTPPESQQGGKKTRPSGTQQPDINPAAMFGLPPDKVLYPTPTNQNPQSVVMIAPYVKAAADVAAVALTAPKTDAFKSGLTVTQVNLLEQVGMLKKGEKDYNYLMGIATGLPQNDPLLTGGNLIPAGDLQQGKWEPYNMGGTSMPEPMDRPRGRGGNGGNNLADYSGYMRNNYGSYLGLTNWRGI
jgi:hypothetical protein